jgi:hypothetical protein
MGFHVDACEARCPERKGKTERRVGVWKRLAVAGRAFDGLAGLQGWTDALLGDDARRWICPATGRTVAESWDAEKPTLRPLPALLPEPFDTVRTAPVHKDCTVRFEGRSYVVPFAYVGRRVEVRGCSGTVQVLDPQTAAVLVAYPRHTAERLLIDPACYEGRGTDRVLPPKPLGRMARRLQEIAAIPVQARPIDLFAALAEVARGAGPRAPTRRLRRCLRSRRRPTCRPCWSSWSGWAWTSPPRRCPTCGAGRSRRSSGSRPCSAGCWPASWSGVRSGECGPR